MAWDPALAAVEKLISSPDPHSTTCAEHYEGFFQQEGDGEE